jgi:AbrB family looped-hinge helix DNA binding protein
MSESILTTKGQITIPKEVRERLHLEPGDKLYFDVREDGVVMLVAHNEPLESLFGLLHPRRKGVAISDMDPGSADDGA